MMHFPRGPHSLAAWHAIRSLCVGSLIFSIAAIFPESSICIVRKFLGVPCPVCGATRSILALFKLSFVDSFLWNPGLWIGTILFLLVIYSFRDQPIKYQLGTKAAWITIVLIGFIRMIAYKYSLLIYVFNFDF